MSAAHPAGAAASVLRVHEVFLRWAPAYRDHFGPRLPPRHHEVLHRLLACRTLALGGALLHCPHCGYRHYTYHSCNDRHCPQCGQADAEQWRAQHARLLLPVPYFLVTFTVPEPLRQWIRGHPQPGYTILFAASAQALQELAAHPRRLGARLGFLGILHTWTRTLLYHPHVHYLVPGGGLSPDACQWIASRPKFLLAERPLADRCRTLFRQYLERTAPEALALLPDKVWKQHWIADCQPAGSGHHALRYLSRYVFKTATGNRRLALQPNGRLRWPYRDSRTRQPRHVDLQPFEFLRRYLQHILPVGFHRVRYFGWFHPAARLTLNRVRALLRQNPVLTPAEAAAWQPPPDPEGALPDDPPTPDRLHCPRCHRPLMYVGSWARGSPRLDPPERAPP